MKKTMYLDQTQTKEVPPEEAVYFMEAEYDDKTGERLSEKYGTVSHGSSQPKEARLYLFGNSLILEGKKVKGAAIHPMATYHPYEWPKVRVYLDDYLERAAPSAVGKPFMLDHSRSLSAENKITKNVWNKEKAQVEYEGDVSDDVAAMIESGKIKGVSVGLDFSKPGGGMLITERGVIPYAFGFEEYSFLQDMEPGDPKAWVSLCEAMETQEFTTVDFKDANAFKKDSWRETWINQDLGIKIVHGILKDGGESYVPAHLIFYKIKGWTSDKIESWLRDNPQYGPMQQAKVEDFVKPALPVTGETAPETITEKMEEMMNE
jgi:hypothetical protein